MDYIIQIDGDIILNHHFIKDHKRFARKNSFVSGSRLNIQSELSKKLIIEEAYVFQSVIKEYITGSMEYVGNY